MTSFNQLVQELIAGTVRRNTFTQWELELLLDLQTCKIRKASRADLLRRYLKAVQQEFAAKGSAPLRLSVFVERENQQRAAAQVGIQANRALGAPCAS